MALPTGGTALLNPIAILTRVGLRAGQHVADLGCGVTGHIVIPAARIVGSEGKVYAVDVQKAALAATESRAKLEGIANITSVWADIERVGATPIPAASLDLAVVVNTLFLTRDRTAVLREAARLTKAGGIILVIEWKVEATPVGPPITQRIGMDAIRTAARAAGLTEREVFTAGPSHDGVVFVKPS